MPSGVSGLLPSMRPSGSNLSSSGVSERSNEKVFSRASWNYLNYLPPLIIVLILPANPGTWAVSANVELALEKDSCGVEDPLTPYVDQFFVYTGGEENVSRSAVFPVPGRVEIEGAEPVSGRLW